MPKKVPSPPAPPRWNPGTPEAQRLAEALRSVRLSLLLGEPGTGKTALLTDGVLPLLRRRAVDAAVNLPRGESQVILPFPERRSQARARLAEVVIQVDGWALSPLGRLHDAIDAALREAGLEPEPRRKLLADRVHALGQHFGTQFLFVFDRFEELLDKPVGDPGRELVLDQLVQLLNRRLQANVLIAMRTQARERFAPFGDRLYGVDDAEVLQLPDLEPPAPVRPPPDRPAPRLRSVARASAPAAAPTPTPMATVDLPLEIELPSAVPGTAAAAAPAARAEEAPAAIPATPARPAAAPTPETAAAAARPVPAAERSPIAPLPYHPSSAHAGLPTWRRSTLAMAVLALAVVALGAIWNASRPELPEATQAEVAARVTPTIESPAPAPRAAATPAPAAETIAARPPPAAPTVVEAPPVVEGPTVAAAPVAAAPSVSPATPPAVSAPSGLPAIDLLIEDEGEATPRLPVELARTLATEGGVELRVRRGPIGTRASTAAAPHLALMRYDALQAARGNGARPALAVVTPLYTEELFVAVRADSALRYLHQLEGLRIDVGPAQGGRALTASALYRRMFDKPMPKSADAALGPQAALQRLAAGGPLDAVLMVAPQPAAAWAALSPETRSGLRLLALDPEHPASRKALQAYLPGRVRAPNGGAGTPTLAAMTFLVAAGTPDAAQADALGRVARTLCSRLPALQRDGDAKWREVHPGLELDTGWPIAPAAAAAWRGCGDAPASTRTPFPAADRSPLSPTPKPTT